MYHSFLQCLWSRPSLAIWKLVLITGHALLTGGVFIGVEASNEWARLNRICKARAKSPQSFIFMYSIPPLPREFMVYSLAWDGLGVVDWRHYMLPWTCPLLRHLWARPLFSSGDAQKGLVFFLPSFLILSSSPLSPPETCVDQCILNMNESLVCLRVLLI